MNKPAETNKSRTWLKLSGLLLGIVVLVWLPVEESSQVGVLVIAGLVCTWGAIWLLLRIGYSGKHTLLRHIVIGGGAGLLLVPLAILLMAIKTGIHGHGTPDYTLDQMQDLLSRMPFFALGGVLLGAGSGLLRTAKDNKSQEG